jgi:integrase
MLFAGPLGGLLLRRNFSHHWTKARAAAGVPHLHFHDLRHLAATLAATTGATTRELMARMGHASPRAALIYQHATRDRDAAITQALSERAKPARVA